MGYVVLQSSADPNYFVVTNNDNLQRAVQAYATNEPNDQLNPAVRYAAERVLAELPCLEVAQNFIDMVGYFGHASEGHGVAA